MKCSCIDVGSNTVKVSVFEKNGQEWNTAGFYGEQTGLINYVETDESGRRLSHKGVEVLISTLGRLIAFSEEKGTDCLFAFATASLRGIENSDFVVKKIYEEYGVNLEILSTYDEAMCSLKGLLTDDLTAETEEGVMIDMGGGSTELVHFANGKLPVIAGLGFGCLSLFTEYADTYPPTFFAINDIRKKVREELGKYGEFKKLGCPVFLIGGTARAALKLICEMEQKNKKELSAADFKLIFEKMLYDGKTRKIAEKIIPKRFNIITAGCAAYFELLDFISPKSVYVSESGVREGYLQKILT